MNYLSPEAGYIVLFVEPLETAVAQRAARVSLGDERGSELSLRGEGLPPLDHPTLGNCGDELWLAGEVVVSESADGGEEARGIVAIPFACML